MIELNDDLLNKYIDGELGKEKMKQVREKLESSSHEMSRYKALLLVHNELQKITAEETSSNFTATLMLRIQRSLKSKREQNFFFISVLSLFLLICLGIIGYLLANYIYTADPDSSRVFTQLTDRSQDFVILLKNFFSKGNISIIGSVFSFILLISGYIFYESVKHSKQH
jgi:anti-sigma factor RsiW